MVPLSSGAWDSTVVGHKSSEFLLEDRRMVRGRVVWERMRERTDLSDSHGDGGVGRTTPLL